MLRFTPVVGTLYTLRYRCHEQRQYRTSPCRTALPYAHHARPRSSQTNNTAAIHRRSITRSRDGGWATLPNTLRPYVVVGRG